MTDRYGAWTKARLSAELRARGMPSRGATAALRERLRALDADDVDDTGTAGDREAAAGRDVAAAEEPASGAEAADEGRTGRAVPAGRLPRRAIDELQAITGRRVDRVVALRSDGGGWQASLDVVEHARTPPSEDLLVSYRVRCDRRGQVRACQRTGAHVRAERQRRAQRP